MTTSLQDKLAALELTDPERNLLAGGFCPKCREQIRGKFTPVPKGSHFLAPEIYETMRRTVGPASDPRAGREGRVDAKRITRSFYECHGWTKSRPRLEQAMGP